ncbi:MAG: ACT domain-containing protein [Ruminiclostridium sp.]|jgi:ACT domain-containing protein|nr:ACT domain-containing protein [Ruminiclostridium sp.]
MTVKQLSVFVENRPGRLCAVTEALAEANINIRAVSIADTKDFGIMRIIVNNTDKAVDVLKEKGFIASAANVIAVIADDKPGSMASIMKTLYNDNISVEYMYAAFINSEKDTACLILRVDNNDKAETALSEAGCKLLTEAELSEI